MSGQGLHGIDGGRILVVHQGALGDLILALPAILGLRECLQPDWLELMGHSWNLPLAHGRPYADAVIDANRADMAPLFQEGARLPEGLRTYLRGFDAAFCFSRSTTLACNLRQAGINRTFLLPPFSDRRMHLMDHHLASLAAIGISPSPTLPRISLSHEAREEARRFLLQRGWDLDGIIALHPGAGSSKKAWPAARFAELGRALAQGSNKILICQGPADAAMVQEVLAGLGSTPYLLVADLPITRLAALLSHARLVIGNDSGISHLAAALGVPILAIFGPTDPLCWAPRSDKAFWLQGPAVCAPCSREQLRSCDRQRCLESLETEAVLAFITEKKMIPLTAAFNDRRPVEIERLNRQYGEAGISVPPP